MYRIGMFSKINKVTIKTLRYYDEVGLLCPAYIDEENNYRYYTSEQMFELHKVISLRQIGFSIEEVLSILNGCNVDGILEQRKAEIIAQLNENQDQLSRVKYYIMEKKEGFNMNYQAIIKELPECIVFYKRLVVPNYDSFFKLIPQIGKDVTEANPNLKCQVPEYCFNIYHDGEYKEKDIDVEICEAVTEFGKEVNGIKFKKIPSVTAVSVLHKGAYKDLGKAYAYAFKWIENNNYTVLDNPRESYIDGIWNKENDEDWLTEIQIPIVIKTTSSTGGLL